jgi:hypothetical protein
VREERLALGKVLVKGDGELAAALLLVVERGERGRARVGGGEDGVLEADALGAAELKHRRVDVRQVAARERVDELHARIRGVGRGLQRAVLGVSSVLCQPTCKPNLN